MIDEVDLMRTTLPYEVIESLCASGKGSEARKEDRLVLLEDFVAVVDGATSSGPIDGRPGGIVAAEAVAASLEGLAADAVATDFAEAATKAIAAAIGPDSLSTDVMPPSAAAVVWSRARSEVWRIGDCHVRVDGRDHPGEKEIDKIAYAFRCAVVKARLALGRTDMEAERRIPTLEQPFMPLVSVQHAFLNVDSDDPLAYGALCGRPVPGRFVEVIPATGAREIVLCSDGFLTPAATLAEGLADLARVRETDPLMVNRVSGSRPFPPGGAYFDDTTYVRFRP